MPFHNFLAATLSQRMQGFSRMEVCFGLSDQSILRLQYCCAVDLCVNFRIFTASFFVSNRDYRHVAATFEETLVLGVVFK